MSLRRNGIIAGIAVALGLAACASGGGGATSPAPSVDNTTGSSEATGTGSTAADMLSIAHVINGALGGQNFFEDAETGISELAAAGHVTATFETEDDNPAQWQDAVTAVSGGNWDVVVVGSWQMKDIISEAVVTFPEQRYLFYDVPFEHPNVASVLYKQNEGSFLAGVLAAQVTTNSADFPLSGEGKVVGIVAGMDVPTLNDFVVGFQAGVAAVDPSIEVLVNYVGSYSDPDKGYAQATEMFDRGADVVFQAAGASGDGVLRAAKEANKYGIGVDQNQNQSYPGHILTSVLKHVGTSIILTIEAAQDGEDVFGSTITYGLENDGVGLTFEGNGAIVPQSVLDTIEQYKQQIIAGEISVPSALD